MPQRNVFFAGQNFKERNLVCSKGERLPDRWQEPGLVAYLRGKYGQNAVVAQLTGMDRRGEAARGAGLPRKGKTRAAEAPAEAE